MTEEVGAVYKVDIRDLIKAQNAEKEYAKRLAETRQQMDSAASSSRQMDQARRSSAQATNDLVQSLRQSTQATEEEVRASQQASDQLGAQTRATQQLSQSEKDAARAAREKAQADKEAAREAEKHTDAIRANTKQLLFMAIGAASVFRLTQKLKQAFVDVVKEMVGNSEEAKRLEEAQNKLKVSFVGVIGDSERWRGILDRLATGVSKFAEMITIAGATLRGMGAIAGKVFQDTAIGIVNLGQAAQAALSGNFAEANRLATEAQERFRLTIQEAAAVYLPAYDRALQEAANAQREYSNALLKTDRDLNEQKDRIKDVEKAEEELDRARDAFAEAQRRRLEALADLQLEERRRLEDIALETARALSDVALKGARKREDIEIAYRRKLEDIEKSQAAARAQAAERLALKLLQIELRFREQMIRIQEDFSNSIWDAIQKRDATAALLAIRKRQQDEGRARRERANAILLATEEAKLQRNEQQRNLERQREDAKLARQRALEDLARDLARERQDISTNQQRELDDLRVYLERKRADIEADYQRRIAAAREQWAQEEAEYQQHLDTQYNKLQSHITRMSSLTIPPLPPYLPTIMKTQPDASFATGGDMIFRKPSTISVAERGPERVIAQPLNSNNVNIAGTIRHQVGGSINAAMDGFSGRLSSMVTDIATGLIAELLS